MINCICWRFVQSQKCKPCFGCGLVFWDQDLQISLLRNYWFDFSLVFMALATLTGLASHVPPNMWSRKFVNESRFQRCEVWLKLKFRVNSMWRLENEVVSTVVTYFWREDLFSGNLIYPPTFNLKCLGRLRFDPVYKDDFMRSMQRQFRFKNPDNASELQVQIFCSCQQPLSQEFEITVKNFLSTVQRNDMRTRVINFAVLFVPNTCQYWHAVLHASVFCGQTAHVQNLQLTVQGYVRSVAEHVVIITGSTSPQARDACKSSSVGCCVRTQGDCTGVFQDFLDSCRTQFRHLTRSWTSWDTERFEVHKAHPVEQIPGKFCPDIQLKFYDMLLDVVGTLPGPVDVLHQGFDLQYLIIPGTWTKAQQPEITFLCLSVSEK